MRCLALQADGAITVGGDFATLGGQARSRIGRLLADGSVDTNFNAGADVSVESLTVQADGKILIGGSFSTLDGQPCHALGRLNANGTLDASFNPGANGDVLSLVVQPDGNILVGGSFTSLGGQSRSFLGRLNSNGSLDTSFNPRADNSITCLALETDGRIVAGGTFATLGGVPLNGLGRLNPNGTPDLTFAPGGGSVNALALQKDGSIVVGGAFSMLAGQPRASIGRLPATGPATETLAFDNSSVTWLRAGLGTEVWRATFELSTNGSSWAAPGDAVRIAGGWQLAGLSIPSNSIVRARGFAVGGNWFVETVAGLPVLTSQPISLTNNATATATFSVTAYGGTPLTYQWLKNGISLNDGGNVSGAHTAVLTLTNVLGADVGGYSVMLSNATGSITSLVASLSVVDSLLTSQPVSQAKNAGQTVTFSVTALGTAPGFQWLQNGTNLNDGGNAAGAQTPTLTLTNLTGGNAGSYQAIVSNAWGSVTSLVASLSVVDPIITANPTTQAVQGGQPVHLSVVAAGAQPLSYQWRRNGAPVPDATNASLNFINAQGANAGFYDVIVTNIFGSTTSTVATLTVNMAATDGFNPGANQVFALAIQPDGKVLVGLGAAAQAVRSPLRFNPGGALDPGFNPGIIPGAINALAVQPDGEILVAGSAQSRQTALGAWRLYGDGSVDAAFTNAMFTNLDGLLNPTAYCVALQPDGKLVLGGSFTIGKPAVWTNLARFNGDGTLDTNFIAGANSLIDCLALQPDGAILVGGNFTTLSGQAHTRLGRFSSGGTLDTNFNPIANSTVNCLLVQPDGKVLVGGSFTALNGQSINHLAACRT